MRRAAAAHQASIDCRVALHSCVCGRLSEQSDEKKRPRSAHITASACLNLGLLIERNELDVERRFLFHRGRGIGLGRCRCSRSWRSVPNTPHHLWHHHLAMHGQRHDLGRLERRLRVVRPGLLRLALGLPVRRLRVRPGLLGHDDGLLLGLGLPVHRLRLHDGEAARTYIFRGEDHGLGGRLHDCYGLGGRLNDCYGGRLHDWYGLGGRLNDCSLDDCSLDGMGHCRLSLKFWREARRLLGLHRVGAATGRTPRRSAT